MKPLTVYIMDGDKNHLPLHTITNSIDSDFKIVEEVCLLPHRNLDKAVKDCRTKWFMYVFDNEYLSVDLSSILPQLILLSNDVYVFYERELMVGGDYKYGQSPRLFKKGIELNGMSPLNINKLVVQRVLDGFVER